MNNLLQNEKSVPFEFLINGQFLRTTIDEFLTANGVSAEATLNVEYVRALIPPVHVRTFEHDDWVSSVDILSSSSPAANWSNNAAIADGQERIVSGCYDGMIRIFNMSGQLLATSAGSEAGGHSASVKGAKFLSPTQIVSAGADRTIRLWDYEEESILAGSIAPSFELYGHKSSVDSISVHQPSSRILSASSDHTVGLWNTSASKAPAAPANLLPRAANKRRKLSQQSVQSDVPQRGPLAILSGHTAPVSEAVFAPNDYTVAYSASWDNTVKTWDLTTQSIVDTRTTSHALLSLTVVPTVNLLVTGTSARHISCIDPRASATSVVAMTLRGHANAVVSLARNPDSEWGLCSGSHDGSVRVWDLRSVRTSGTDTGLGLVGESVYAIERDSIRGKESRPVGGKGVKVFGVAWDKQVGIVSGGEDKRVQINRNQG